MGVVTGSWRHGRYSLMEVCVQYTLLPEGSCAALGPDRSISSLDFCWARTKNMPPWTQSPRPRCEHEHLLVDHTTGLHNSMPPMGSGGHDRVLVFPMTGHLSLRFALLGASLLRVTSGSLRAHSGAVAVQDDAVGKPPAGGNRAYRLIPHILLLLYIREHQWLALHSRVVELPVHPRFLPEIVRVSVHLASSGREVAMARPDPSPSVHHCRVIELSLLFPLPG
jgi:hypothetical protein